MTDQTDYKSTPDWDTWRTFFAARSGRDLPALDVSADYANLPASLARSLAVFQLGESGGGTIIEQAARSRLPGVTADYAEAVRLFVDEEHRHANILAMCVRLLGGELVQKNWTARLFVQARRLIGLRLKVLVLLAAEVVGICYYSSLAGRLSPGPVREWLLDLVHDERAHLEFHCEFLRSQCRAPWQRRLFVATWRIVMLAAGQVVMLDHRNALRDLGIDRKEVAERWGAIAELAERLVTDADNVERRSVIHRERCTTC